MHWEFRQAEQQFANLLESATQEPQPIYYHERLLAFVVDGELFQEFLTWHGQRQQSSVADAFAQLREVCSDDNVLEDLPPRQDRSNPFLDMDDDVFV